MSAKVSQRNRSALEPDRGLDHYSGRTTFAFCRFHMFIDDKVYSFCYTLFFFLVDFQGTDLVLISMNPLLMSTLKFENKQQRFYSTSFFSLLLLCQNLLISKSSVANLFCHATTIVLYLRRKKILSVAFLKFQECRGMPHPLFSVCRQPLEIKK